LSVEEDQLAQPVTSIPASRITAVEADVCYPTAVSNPSWVSYPMAVPSIADAMSIAEAWPISVVSIAIVPVAVNTVGRAVVIADGGRIAIAVNFRRIAVAIGGWRVAITIVAAPVTITGIIRAPIGPAIIRGGDCCADERASREA